MKKIKIINRLKKGAALLAGLISLSSCLKNGNYYTDFAAVGASVDLPLAASKGNDLAPFTYDATITSASIPVYINLSSPKTLGTAVTATLGLDTAYLNSYNSDNGTSFEVLPDSVYTIAGGWDRNIPAGKRLDSMVVNLDLTKLDLAASYILPITIAQASVPIEQWNHLMLYISVKNQYDGHYSVTGTFSDVSNGAFTDNYPMEVNLVTSGPNSVDVFNLDVGGVYYEFLNGGTPTYYGSFGVRMFIDPATNNITSVINVYGQPAGNTRSAQLDPSGINKRDPSTGDIDVKYFMIQPSVIPAPPSIRSYFNEHYKYLGPR